ncbi:Vacuolar protein sorting-associated protein [Klebsormidium nitens]|uniref:Vacuolar protein sorting-associated protein 28 homolog n=1 Tax=Klebsormidium nitens TaxID=105231 RepID=A0A0U9HKA5_KLENI|nr:Vacuolar protein sorting-associated protein [Klebsormidium nitens]|eukprot:GAQ86421.1 Vacuolar protein sorting-associated protein [Klebsormidium nitens]
MTGTELKLWNDKAEREMYENFADLYAIIKTTEKLEKAYVRDVISAKEYEPACLKLIAQFRTLRTTLKDSVPDVERFMSAYKLECPAAVNRLLQSGLPATVEHGRPVPGEGPSSAMAVAETVQHFITAMDSLKLSMVAVDQVYPLLSDLVSSMNRVPQLPPDFEGKVKGKDWISRLAKMSASDELNEGQARQLLFDLESSYTAFMNSLPKSS